MLSWYIDGELSSPEGEELQQHLEGCNSCKDYLALLQGSEGYLKGAAEAYATPLPSLDQKIAKTKQKVKWITLWHKARKFTMVAASILVVGLAGYWIYFNLLPISSNLVSIHMPSNEWIIGTRASFTVSTIDYQAHRPVEGTKLKVELKTKDGKTLRYLSSARTNRDGIATPTFTIPELPEGEYFVCVSANSGYGVKYVERAIRLKRPLKILLTTDRPLYRPGQTIHLRALVLNNFSMKPFKNQEITFEVKDPKGTIIFRKTLPTSRYGIASTDLKLAEEINFGHYSVRAECAGVSSERYVEVKKYVLPKFKVQISTEKRFYRPGEALCGKVVANYFFGKPIRDGKVQIRLLTWIIDRFEEFSKLFEQTDQEGIASFRVTLPRRFHGIDLLKGDAILKIEAIVTDTAGHRESRGLTLPVSRYPIKIDVIPEGGRIVAGLKNRLFVLTCYPDGRPARTRITSPQMPGKAFFTDPSGACEIMIPIHTTPPNLFTLVARDEAGNQAKKRLYLSQYLKEGNFIIRTDKVYYKAGDQVKVKARASFNYGNLYLELIKSGQTIWTEVIQVENRKGELIFDLPLDLMGTVLISAYRIKPNGHIIRDTRVILVDQPKGLQIKTRLLKQFYRPGEPIPLELELRDEDGRSVRGAVGLSVVDEAVFALARGVPALEKVYFALEQDILKPRWQIKAFPRFDRLPQEFFDQEQPQVSPILAQARLSNINLPGFESPISNIEAVREEIYRLRRQREEFNITSFIVLSLITGVVFIIIPIIRGLISIIFTNYRWIVYPVFVVILLYTIGWGSVISYRIPALFFLGIFVIIAIWIHGVSKFKTSWYRTICGCVGGLLIAAIFLVPPLGVSYRRATFSRRPPDRLESISPTQPPKRESPKKVKTGRRVREYFPETLYWNPQIITDENGRAKVILPGADSITTWRLFAQGITSKGEFGVHRRGIVVFQDFFIDIDFPLYLTQGDVIHVPIVVYNYLREPQNVRIEVERRDWFELLDEAQQTLKIGPKEVSTCYFPIKVKKFGMQKFLVHGYGSKGLRDHIQREVEVIPYGKPCDISVSGYLFEGKLRRTLKIPIDAIDRASSLWVNLYPSVLSEVVTGLESLVRIPHGCFEQTSAITYPNVLVMSYLKETGQLTPRWQMKLEECINLGYQRLLRFEVKGGGFEWYGRAPANTVLTAWGILELNDMHKVYPIDRSIIDRARDLLIKRQAPDGSWLGKGAYNWPQIRSKLTITAYVAWALLEAGYKDQHIARAIRYIERHLGDAKDPYVLALCTNVLALAESPKTGQAMDSLQMAMEGNWQEVQSVTYSTGRVARLETIALAALAALKVGNPQMVEKALSEIAASKDSRGGWHSTQSTILCIKALLESIPMGKPQNEANTLAHILLSVNGRLVPDAFEHISGKNYDVMQQVNLTEYLKEGENQIDLMIVEAKELIRIGYQILARYYIPWDRVKQERKDLPLELEVRYDKDSLKLGDKLTCDVRLKYKGKSTFMVILDLGIPAGFDVEVDSFERLVRDGVIDRYDLTGRQIILYLGALRKGQQIRFSYKLRPRYPAELKTPRATVYEYYNPENTASTLPVSLIVTQ
jgi:uncharacterized protein YfaS (alpha-2-macroglobulin family)